MGSTQIYICELVGHEPGFGMLRYVVEREYDMGGNRLMPGDVTIALYWEDRPYTLYIWDLGQRGGRLFYFNVADSTALRPGGFVWRDLAIDILIDGEGNIAVLDEHELPQDISGELKEYIGKAVALIVKNHREIIREADELIERIGNSK